MMDKFIFGVLAYNQEGLITQTLESIKYQKINFGNEIDVKLIVVDDASRDNTVSVVNEWISKNRAFFVDTICIANEKNRGTVANYQIIMDSIKDEHFKIIAGDDLISSENLFKEYDDLTDNLIKSYARIYLKNNVILYDENDLIDFYYHLKHAGNQKYNLKNFRRGCFFHTPSTLFAKKLFINANCKEAIEGYVLFEDDPTWYCMLNRESTEIKFIDKGIVLYRIHDKAVSNAPNPIFEKDLLKLRKKYCNDTRGFEHIYFCSRINTKLPKYLKLDKYVDKILHLYRKSICVKDKNYTLFLENIKSQVEKEQKYFDKIMHSIVEEK